MSDAQAPHVDLAVLTAIARRHGLPLPDALSRPWVGATSRVYPCGEMVIKIPFDTPAAIASLRSDAAVVPVVQALGVTAPEVIALDETLDLVPVPYAVVRRVHAVPLERCDRGLPAHAQAWRDVGRQLALVHVVRDEAAVPVPLRHFRQTPEVDPRPWVSDLGARGVPEVEASWLHHVLDAHAPARRPRLRGQEPALSLAKGCPPARPRPGCRSSNHRTIRVRLGMHTHARSDPGGRIAPSAA